MPNTPTEADLKRAREFWHTGAPSIASIAQLIADVRADEARAREGAASATGASAWRKEAPKPADVRRFGAHWWNKTEKGRPHIVCLEIDGVDDDEEFVIASDGITEAEWRGEWAPCTPPAPPTASAPAVSVEGKTVATGRVVSVGEKRIGIAFRTLNGIGVGDEVRIVVTPLDGGEG